MRERRRWRFDAFLGCDFQRSFERELDLARSFLACFAVRHDAGPLYLGYFPQRSTATALLPGRDPNPPAMSRFPTAPFSDESGTAPALLIATP